MSQFDLSGLRGVKAKPTGTGQYRNRRFSDSDVRKIRECVDRNDRRRGVLSAIARKTGTTPSTIWWIVDGRAYK